MTEYTFRFTLDQVNKIVACMNNGPFGQVNEILNELRHQMQAQNPPPPVVPPAPGSSPTPPGNGEQPLTS